MRSHLKLFTAFSFLKLKSADLLWFQWIYPVIICVIVQVGFWLLPNKPSILGNGGIVESTNDLMSMLIGFYIAALAAIASFKSDTLDKPMKGRAPEIIIRRGGGEITEKLTRRRFLCILFGYCAFISILIYVAGAISIILQPSLLALPLFVEWETHFRLVWIGFYFFFVSSLLVTTLLGLHYLIDRMHRE